MQVKSYAITAAGEPLQPHAIERRAPGAAEVLVELFYCGICHTDLAVAEGKLAPVEYPLVPGHEMVGRVVETGSAVDSLAVGDWVGIGCIADSCRSCGPCDDGDEQYCDSGFAMSFNARDVAGNPTYGGYSTHYTLHERYALKLPEGLDPAGAAPLLCGGITVYTPLVRCNAGPGRKVGVLGLGGLGHLAVKMAKAMGAETVMLTGSPGKVADAGKLGADDVVLTSDAGALARHQASFDLIIDTVCGPHEPDAYLALLRRAGTLYFVGSPGVPLSFQVTGLIRGDKMMAGSLIGGIPRTAEMLQFCARHDIVAEIEMVDIAQVNEAWQRLEDNDVRYRFVLDLASLK